MDCLLVVVGGCDGGGDGGVQGDARYCRRCLWVYVTCGDAGMIIPGVIVGTTEHSGINTIYDI